MTSRLNIIRIAKALTLGISIASLASCQPIGYGDPLDQDAFATEGAPIVPGNSF